MAKRTSRRAPPPPQGSDQHVRVTCTLQTFWVEGETRALHLQVEDNAFRFWWVDSEGKRYDSRWEYAPQINYNLSKAVELARKVLYKYQRQYGYR